MVTDPKLHYKVRIPIIALECMGDYHVAQLLPVDSELSVKGRGGDSRFLTIESGNRVYQVFAEDMKVRCAAQAGSDPPDALLQKTGAGEARTAVTPTVASRS